MRGVLDRQRLFAFLFQKRAKTAEIRGLRDGSRLARIARAAMETAATPSNQGAESLSAKVRSAVIWRSGSQILAQMVQWAATFLVIRILSPADYGLFAMTGVVLVFLNMLNGYGLASGLIQQPDITRHQIRQLFGMLIVLNVALGGAQLLLAPVAAAYYRHPEVADLLRVQAMLYLDDARSSRSPTRCSAARWISPSRRGSISSPASPAPSAALGGALAGWGVWTLVFAPIVLFTSRAVGMTIAARSLVWPSFDFRGAGHLAKYGGVMAAGQLFWFAAEPVRRVHRRPALLTHTSSASTRPACS